jgi:transcription termination/antitermination protein NusA
LLQAGDDFLRQAAAGSAGAMMPDFSWQGRQPRAVQANGMFEANGVTYGPLSEDLIRRQVDVDIQDGVVEVFYERELQARFDQETGERLPLDDIDDFEYKTAAVSDDANA